MLKVTSALAMLAFVTTPAFAQVIPDNSPTSSVVSAPAANSDTPIPMMTRDEFRRKYPDIIVSRQLTASAVNFALNDARSMCRIWLRQHPEQTIASIRAVRRANLARMMRANQKMMAEYAAGDTMPYSSFDLVDALIPRADDPANASYRCMKLLGRWPASATKK